MDVYRFQLFNVLGAVIWVTSLVYGGYLFGNLRSFATTSASCVPRLAAAAGPVLIAGAVRLPAHATGARAG